MTNVIDSIGIGKIIPVMPDLLIELSNLSPGKAAIRGGYLSFVFLAAVVLMTSSLLAFTVGLRRIG